MAYPDQKYYTRQVNLWGQAVDFGTAGGTTVSSADAVKQLPKFFRKTKVNKLRLRCTTIPNAEATALVASFLNGTDTFATVTLTTATADQSLDATVTSANAVFDADSQPTVKITGTATASGDSLGDFDIWAETQEVYE